MLLLSFSEDVLAVIIRHARQHFKCRCISKRFKTVTSLIPGIDVPFSSFGNDENAAGIAKFIRQFKEPHIICQLPWRVDGGWFSAILDCLSSGKRIGSVLMHVKNANSLHSSRAGLKELITRVLDDQQKAVVGSLGSLKIHLTTKLVKRADLDDLIWATGFCNIRELRVRWL
jgi:hypothetical protein